MKRLLVIGLLIAGAGTLSAQVPSTHNAADWLQKHGGLVATQAATCGACHAQESCFQCHRGNPEVAAALPTAAAGTSMNVQVERHRPASHTPEFVNGHGSTASARPESCAGCHVRQDCLECHRPNAAEAGGYHEPGFLSSHPQQAYTREVSCANCHNTGSFCQSCHQQAGLVSDGAINRGYHDKVALFLGGHGQAARQSLESCVSCHTENDCLTCHRQFDPHGPGFNPSAMQKRAENMCRTCHGATIPEASRRRP
jgi:predicted CXXCH cytochrome family protein